MTTTFPSGEPSKGPLAGSTVRDLVADFSIEATPKHIADRGGLAGILPAGTHVYVPFLPGADFADTVEACATLRRDGFRPVPHLAARAVAGRDELGDWLERLSAAGADALLLIAGDLVKPRGAFGSTLDVFDTGLLERHGFRSIGVAGHPEGHPVVDEAELTRALAHKAAYARSTGAALQLVTQFVFEAEPVCRWLDRLAEQDFGPPARVGLPGPAKPRTLIAYALQCGVAASARMLRRRPNAAGMLFGRWYPDEILLALADYRAKRPDAPLAGVHAFPFGGLQRSAEWFGALKDGSLVLAQPDGAGEAEPA